MTSIDCTVRGNRGDGTESGTCNQNEVCHANGRCLRGKLLDILNVSKEG